MSQHDDLAQIILDAEAATQEGRGAVDIIGRPDPWGTLSSADCARIQSAFLAVKKCADRVGRGVNQQDNLYDLLAETSVLEMEVRSRLLRYISDPFCIAKKESVSTVLSMEIWEPEDALIRLMLPPLVGRHFRGSYNIYHKTKLGLSWYRAQNGLPDIGNKKVVMIYKRYIPDFSTMTACDNDNWEMQRVTNAVAEAFGCTDGPLRWSFLYTSVGSDINCTEATLVEQEKLGLFLDYLGCSKVQINPSWLPK